MEEGWLLSERSGDNKSAGITCAFLSLNMSAHVRERALRGHSSRQGSRQAHHCEPRRAMRDSHCENGRDVEDVSGEHWAEGRWKTSRICVLFS